MSNEIPRAVLSQLNEHCGGGYMLFRIDGDGNFDFNTHFDNQVIARGLIDWASQILSNMKRTNKDMMEIMFDNEVDDYIEGQIEFNDEDDDEDDDEDYEKKIR